ncbi:Cdc25 family phosphatase-like protein Ibp1 [Clohesyomyces aquaticus]|uniref:Cdc25 family phosphatase-like protein Ibp1 n=1 Tax=Clohesyomyces aquaticus TaxID=1231657 RepID=A0A1Y1Z0C8_9PLEO|nr:Cdc25 family phosphatase-like protein Ibp1 [Clohesyomyces aquaticus]
MSDITISSLPVISREQLSSTLLSSSTSGSSTTTPPPHIAIIDVRDSDHIGGHIKGSTHIPSSQLDYRIPELVRTLQGKETVVFHCALSQQRGPSAALRYLREKRRVDGEGAKKQKVVVLEGGFTKWQEKFGEDERLTEAYQKDVWAFGY